MVGGRLTAIASLVAQCPFERMMIVNKFAQNAFIVKAPWTIFQGIQVRERKRFSRFILASFHIWSLFDHVVAALISSVFVPFPWSFCIPRRYRKPARRAKRAVA